MPFDRVSPNTHNTPKPAPHPSKNALNHTPILFPPTPQPRLPHHTRRNNPPQPRPNTNQHARPNVPTVHQNLQRRNIIHNNRPTNRRRAARQVIVPNDQQYGKQLRAATNQQRGAERRRVGVVRDQRSPRPAQGSREGRRVEAREQADGQVEGEGAERDEEEEEEVLQDQRLGLQDRGVGGCGCGRVVRRGRGERQLFDARPGQVDVEEEEEDAEAEDRALRRVSGCVRKGRGVVTSNLSSSRPRRLKRRCRYTWTVSSCLFQAIRVTIYLGFDQDQINEEHHEVMLDVLVGELLAARTLCQTDALPQGPVVGF